MAVAIVIVPVTVMAAPAVMRPENVTTPVIADPNDAPPVNVWVADHV